MSSSSLSNLPESGTHTPPAYRPLFVKSSPVGKIQRCFVTHKHDQVQAFDESIQQLEFLTPEKFLDCLRVSDKVLLSEIPDSLRGLLSIDGFCFLVNDIARSIKVEYFPKVDNLLVFKDTGNETPDGHVTGTQRSPDITAAFKRDWTTDGYMDWALIQLAGERA